MQKLLRHCQAQLGVYQVADDDGNVLSVGYAGARHLFGIQARLTTNSNFTAYKQRNSVTNLRLIITVAGMSS